MNRFKIITSNILKELGYCKVQEISRNGNISLSMFMCESKDKFQCYVVSICNKEFFQTINFEELQKDIYQEIKNTIVQKPEFEKNISWLLGVECENDYEDLIGKILLVEENPYYFKKTVCPYLLKEVEEFLDEIKDNNSYIDYIQKEIVKVNRFTNFRNSKDDVYNFISRLLIKIPSIELQTVKGRKLCVLHDQINRNIQENELEDIYSFLKENTDKKINLIDDEIDTLYNLYNGKGEKE